MKSSPKMDISFIVKNAQEGKDPIHPYDKDIPIAAFRTTSIFHYTKELTNLKRILEDGIIPNFCSEDLASDVTIGIPMVSFCDIPLGRTYEHASKYGYFAIGLATEYGEKNNINPVFYVSNSDIMDMILRRTRNGYVDIKRFLSSPISGLYKKCYGQYNNKEISNYAENEWRYVVPQTRQFRWYKSESEYKEWRQGGIGNKKPNPINNPDLYNNRLRFKVFDINYLIVEKEELVPQLVSYICNLKTIGGTTGTLSITDKLYLISRIRSIESIRRDY
ncbi:MAG: hypothetical protein K2L17_11115 [Muribaculaceae bacterium]|nr:hypothetical protein [Muribaculaceae bacterium]